MEIIANCSIRYRIGESILGVIERLEIVVKFKENRKVFKTTLTEDLASTFYLNNSNLVPKELREKYKSYEDYYGYIEEIINDKEYIEKVAINMINEYFNNKNDEYWKENKRDELSKRINSLPEFEIKVKIN